MKATNALVQNATAPKTFSAFINGANMRAMIEKSIGDPRRAASFVSTLISTVSASPRLKECEPGSIVSSALRGEGMNLSIALGQYSIVPYGKTANYQISYKGMAQLAIRSGQYRDFDVFDVRMGEYKGRDPKTRNPIIEWVEDEEEREALPLAGFYGFYQLNSGFFKSIYWSHEKILLHANRYSKAFDKSKYESLLKGELSKDEAERLRSGSPWYDDPLSEAHMKMCKKTVLIQLLGDGKAPLSIEMQQAFDEDRMVEEYSDTPVTETIQEHQVIEAEGKPIPTEPTPGPKTQRSSKGRMSKTAQDPPPSDSPAAEEPMEFAQNDFFDNIED